MKIATSNVQMSSVSARESKTELSAGSRWSSGASSGAVSQGNVQGGIVNRSGVLVGISEEASFKYQQQNLSEVSRFSEVVDASGTASQYLAQSLLHEATEVTLSGRSAATRLLGSGILQNGSNQGAVSVAAVNVTNGQLQASDNQATLNAGQGRVLTTQGIEGIQVQGEMLIEMNQYVHHTEAQYHQFSSNGSITTEDGRTINFGLHLVMSSREEIEAEANLIIEQVQLRDPLVLNFGAETATLTDQFFEFDIDADGSNDQIARLGQGSGYLMLDLNGNGQVDDGSELFGAASGNGFEDLAAYDSDGNLWIDENDPIFEQLKVWTVNAQGEDELISLKDTGVGAIYLGQSAADFDLKSSSGQLLGNIKAEGIMLMENGEVRSVQELDLADHSEPTTQEASENGQSLEGDQAALSVMSDEDIDERTDELNAENMIAMQQVLKEQEAEAAEQRKREQQQRRLEIATMTDAIGKLDEIREQQSLYGDKLREQMDDQKTLLEQLVDVLSDSYMTEEEREKIKADKAKIDQAFGGFLDAYQEEDQSNHKFNV